MAPTYKLIYFNVRGVCEPARFLLKYGGVDFEDVRINKDEQWPQLKEKTPFGQLPLLEHNGKKVAQSVAICRYLGKIVKLAGDDDWENLEIDAIVDTIVDLRSKITLARSGKDDKAKEQALQGTTFKETVPYYLSRLEAIVTKNNGYLALGRLTWADVYFAGLAPALITVIGTDAFEKYPVLKSLVDKVTSLPAIKKWMEERPQTDR